MIWDTPKCSKQGALQSWWLGDSWRVMMCILTLKDLRCSAVNELICLDPISCSPTQLVHGMPYPITWICTPSRERALGNAGLDTLRPSTGIYQAETLGQANARLCRLRAEGGKPPFHSAHFFYYFEIFQEYNLIIYKLWLFCLFQRSGLLLYSCLIALFSTSGKMLYNSSDKGHS